jgi:hypothetical protein
VQTPSVNLGLARDRHQLGVRAGVVVAVPTEIAETRLSRVARDQVPLLNVVQDAIGK